MVRSPSFAAVILAAGESLRMGRDKALLPWKESTFLEAHIAALEAYSQIVLVVAGGNRHILQPVVDERAAFLVINPQPERGQFSSLQAGLQEVLNRGRDAAIVTLVDRPPARAETIAALRCAFENSPHHIWAVVPEMEGRHGHPIVCGREMITAFLQADVSATARDIEHAYHDHVQYLPVEDASTVANINTPQDYERLIHCS